MGKEPLFCVGDHVVRRSDRSQHGHVIGDPELEAGDFWYRVRFEKRVLELIEDELDALPDPELAPSALAEQGQWGKLEALRRVLAVERISRRNRSTVYAFNAQRILFQPYQYKPLLRFLDSPDRRLLIADEVGLGKTIEAGLILTELLARENLEKVLVVCPSRLRQKWREELNRKFGQDFEILSRKDIQSYLRRIRERPDRGRLRAIVSMQVFRSEDLREEFAAAVESVELVIFDEAHHARNPGTLTSDMLHMIGDQIGQAVLLLTATPLHLGSENLFNLLAALRPTEFGNPHLFDNDLQRNRGVLTALTRVRSRNADQLPAAAQELEVVYLTNGGVEDPVARQVIESLRSDAPNAPRAWVELERNVEGCHLLASILTRTRKRDVQENAPTRRSRVIRIQWTDEEERLYDGLLGPACSDGWPRRALDLGQIQRGRQAASCLSAAYHHYEAKAAKQTDTAELFDIDPDDLDPGVGEEASADPLDIPPLPTRDSKLEALIGILRKIDEAESGAKVLVFTFFVGTSLYLQEQLQRAGWPTLRIAGDVPSTPNRPETDKRGQIIARFRTDPEARVLVSTEVGSEGLDFQFAHHIVNYDLPWNPMVVEQRIGRVDRFGQTAPVVFIHTLVVEGTIEDRILRRLYERIEIFERSIGSLEAILGDAVRELQRDYFTGRLTPKEADRRVEEAARAISRRELELEELEREAGTLFGHEDFIRDEMARVRRLGRFLSPRALLTLLDGYLAAHHPRVVMRHEGESVFSLPLDAQLLSTIQDQAPTGSVIAQLQLRAQEGRIRFTTDGEVAFGDPDLELLNATHPLVLAAVEGMRPALEDAVARLGAATLRLPPEAIGDVPEGIVHLAVFAQEVTGVKERIILESVAWCEVSREILDTDDSERLLHLALEQGLEWERTEPPPRLPKEVWRQMVSGVRSRNRLLQEEEQRHNDARYLRRKRVIESERDHRLRLVSQKLETARSAGRSERILRLFEAQLVHVQSRFARQLRDLDERRDVGVALSEPLAICVVEVRE